jgi:hypothetical protein
MVKNITQFKSVVDTFESTFNFDVNTPIGVAKQQIFDCLNWVGKIEESLAEKVKETLVKDEQTQEEPNEQPIA